MPQRNVNFNKILILRFSSLGDIVMSTAMIRCLRKRFPNSRIDMVVREDFLALIAENPHLDQRISLSRASGIRGLLKLVQQLRSTHYDLIYDAHFSVRSIILLMMIRPAHFVRYQKHYVRRSLALTFKLPLLKQFDRMLLRYIEPLLQFGVTFDGKGPEIFGAQSASSAKLVGIIPSAQWPGKRWDAKRFRTLISDMLKETDWNFVIFGGKEDAFCKELSTGFPLERVLNRQGQLTLKETISELTRCKFVIANDTGLMHMADALSVPCVLILGPTSKESGCLPFHPLSLVVEKNDLWCRPCSKNGQAPCIRFKRHCLEIEPRTVFQAALSLYRGLSRFETLSALR